MNCEVQQKSQGISENIQPNRFKAQIVQPCGVREPLNPKSYEQYCTTTKSCQTTTPRTPVKLQANACSNEGETISKRPRQKSGIMHHPLKLREYLSL